MNEIIEGFIQAGELIINLNPEVLEITARSLLISLAATLIASLIAIPIGGFIHFREFGGKRGLITIIQTLYALPTVIAGSLSSCSSQGSDHSGSSASSSLRQV